MKLIHLFSSRKTGIIALALLGLFVACRPEAPVAGEEDIDTVRILIDGQTIEWKLSDTEVPAINLTANKTYAVEVQFWNLKDNKNITTEILIESAEHLVCFDVNTANLTIQATDTDGVYPVGLSSSWETGTSSTGTLILELRHQPGEKDGSCLPGDTDVQADFEVVIM